VAIDNNDSVSNYAYNTTDFDSDTGTVMGWFYFPTITAPAWETAFAVNDNASDDNFVYSNNNSVTPTLAIYAGGGNTAGSTISAATWYHLALTFDGSDYRLYLNGSLDITRTNSLDWRGFRVGSNAKWGEPGDVNIAHIKAWDDTLILEEIQQEIHTIRPQMTANLKYWCPCFNGSSERIKDYSGNGSDLSEAGTCLDADQPPVGWGTRPLVHRLDSAAEAWFPVPAMKRVRRLKPYLVR
jgi:hypothetical protein